MLKGEHSAILLTYIKQKLVLKNNFRFLLEWLFYTGFTVCFIWKVKSFCKSSYLSHVLVKLGCVMEEGLDVYEQEFEQGTLETFWTYRK